MKRTKEDSTRTQQALLDAAATLFARHGVARTTLKDIAAEAGVTRGAVYWHFTNKEDVIRTLWERVAGASHQAFLEQLAQIKTSVQPEQAFRDAVTGVVRRMVSDNNLGQAMRIVMHCAEFSDEQTDLQRFLRSRRNELHGSLQRAFLHLQRSGRLHTELSPKLLTQCLMSYLYGLVHNHLEPGHHPLNLARDGEVMLKLMLDAVLVPQPGDEQT